MISLFRLIGLLGHTPRSINNERTRELYQATRDLDLLEKHLDQIRAERGALRARINRISKQIAEYTEERVMLDALETHISEQVQLTDALTAAPDFQDFVQQARNVREGK